MWFQLWNQTRSQNSQTQTWVIGCALQAITDNTMYREQKWQ
ncbi:hypothetical protein M595_4435 [Lyngbya aestuarii BL J]|uniref:Uncharacterized protein n=1 Tax=Lyngbya aestuarii BL J TaxID=1348334 RepID=U7QCK9_9CYAN|nr:hypothetical protein M595_4435 [Lyngbya aestuarii BL J]